MNIVRTDKDELTATITINLEVNDYAEKVEQELKKIRKKASIPGFRVGKVPMNIIKKMYGKTTKIEEVNSILADAIKNYVDENKLNLLLSPLVNLEENKNIDWDNDVNISFNFLIGLTPEFEINFSALPEIIKYKIKVDDEIILDTINSLRKKYGKLVKTDVSEEADIINANIEEIIQDEKSGKDVIKEHVEFSPQQIKNKDLFIGKKIDDEIIFTLSQIDDNYQKAAAILNIPLKQLKNVDASFKAKITSINKIEPAEVNEEFFKRVYYDKNINNEEEFKKIIKEEIAKRYEKESLKLFKIQVMEMLKNEIKFELPEYFIKMWLKDKENIQDANDEKIEKEYEYYKNFFKSNIIKNKIVAQYNLDVSRDDIKDYVTKYFIQSYNLITDEQNQKLDGIVETILANEEESNKIKEQLIEDKLIDLFLTSLNIVEKEIDYKDFINIVNNLLNIKDYE